MFISLSSTTRTRAGRSVIGSRLFRCCGRRCRRRCLCGLGEKLRIEIDLCGFAHLLDFFERGLLLHAAADARAELLDRLRRVRADLEDVDAETRRNGVADLA